MTVIINKYKFYNKRVKITSRLKNKIKILFMLAAIFTLTNVQAQEYFNYIQSTNNLTPLNSAYSLLNKNTTINASVRKQLVGVAGAPSTFIFNVNLPIESFKAAAGVIVMDDQVAVEHLTEINLFFAKSVQLSEDYFLGVSMNAGLRKYVAGYSTLASNDPQFLSDVRTTQPNIGFGVMLYTKQYYVGISAPELTIRSLGIASVENSNYLKSQYNVTAACLLYASEDIIFKPAGLITYSRGNPVLADLLSTVYLKNTLGIGFDLRTNKVMAGVLTINLDNIAFGYSYQFPTSYNNSGVNFATHGVSFTCRFGKHLSEHKLL